MSDLSNAISPEKNPTMHEKLTKLLKDVHQGWLVFGGTTYRVIQREDGVRVFMPNTAQDLYESTSIVGG
jgi:hypothetical protein